MRTYEWQCVSNPRFIDLTRAHARESIKSQSSNGGQVARNDRADGVGQRTWLRERDMHAARSPLHTYPIIEITVALNAHRV